MPTTEKYIPSIGTKGIFEFETPFDTQVSSEERLTLKSVRTISDYVASNEDVFTDIYVKNQIESTFKDDATEDIEILGLQSERGAWFYIPVRYVKCYPGTNGIPYRALTIVLPLQAIPVDRDLTTLLSQLNSVILAELGFSTNPRKIESSNVVLVSKEAHNALEISRAINRNTSTPYAINLQLSNQVDILLAKVDALENYIEQHP